MTRWWWVRHGPTHAKNMVGWRDLPADLSDTDQIARLNRYLPQDAVIVSSDLSRAVTTADALSHGRRRLPHDPRFREFNFGAWDGMHWTEMSKRDPELSRLFWDEPGVHRAPNGESWNELSARILPATQALNSQGHTDIIVVAHFGAILTQVARAGALTPYQALGHKIDNFSVTRLDWQAENWSISQVNHLP